MPAHLIWDEFQAGRKMLHTKVRILAKKARKKMGNGSGRFLRFNYTDKRKNTWKVLVYTTKAGFMWIPFLEYNDNRGKIRIILQSADGGDLEIFTGHFFSRFKERSKIEQVTGDVTTDIFIFFFKNNQHRPVIGADNLIHVEFPTGVGLGYAYGESVFIIKTFLTHDMLRGSQIELSNRLKIEMNSEM